MNEQIVLIAQRVRGMREDMGFSVSDMAEKTNISVEEYESYERGEHDFNFSFLYNLADIFNIDIVDILSGDVPKLNYYSIVKKDKGLSIERVKTYKYQHLAYTFRNKKFETFLVTVEPKEGNAIHLNQHEGQEFNYIISGKIEFHIADNVIILEEGDSIQFDSSRKHGMLALNQKVAKFLAVVSK